ncbi:MAG: 4-hydroxyphenylacetate 3-hydroxylase family protein [Dethiobacter sp.]|nr:4-hydroxyphenylacetate 3-hydroxylase family protein [Dethiobacter sp.]MCL5983016.1 4-hydroxyphenylacetate 3-hydroxylase family protein [Bacillota bacterium]
MMTGKEYIDSLRQLKTVVYAFGEKLDNIVDHPLIKPHVNAAATTYEMAHDPEFEDLVTATSHLTGEKVSRFTHIHHSTDDLIKKVKMLRAIAQRTGSCYQRCVGFDGINALYATTYEIDQKYGTNYHERMKDFVKYLQKTDKMVAGSMTDPKGDRGLSPGKQTDPDMYVRVVEKNEKGIVIRGAKAHQTGVVNSHEMLIMPTIALDETEKDYAVACAIPVDAPGVLHIFGRQTNDTRKFDEMDQGNACFGAVGGEALTVLEDVFVPWERVFMCGEYDFAGMMVERFACYHRQNYGGCKGGVSDILIGATAAMAEMNGVAKASHIRDKIVEMIHLAETIYCGSVACSSQGRPLPCGSYFVDPLLANVTKLNVTRNIYEICRLSHDIAGGLLATTPSEQDLNHPEVGKYVEKYSKGVDSVPAIERLRMARLLENMTGGTALVESMHGAGSPQAQRVMILRQGNLAHKVKMAKRLASRDRSGNER